MTVDPPPARRPPGPTTRVRALRVGVDGRRDREEQLATEEPLEVRVGERRLAVTMRTPGADFELAVGWLHSEGVLRGSADVRTVRYCTDADLAPDQRFNVVTVDLADPTAADRLPSRSFMVSSACGVCGREALDDLSAAGWSLPEPGAGPTLDPALLATLPERLRERQAVFDRTGGLHAAGLADAATGELLAVREDVGRHNAVDKVVGWALLEGRLPLRSSILVVSGRASYEIAQKALAAGVPALVAVSAPSSLAVAVAARFGMTLAAFARDGRVTLYAGLERVAPTR